MIDILRNRRSTRDFASKTVEKEKFDLIIESALRTPTSRNIKPTEFIVVKEKAVLENLSKVKAHGAEFLKNADFCVAVIGDTTKADTCIEDASIASIVMQLTAESLGMGSCWAQIRLRSDKKGVNAEDNVREILKIPQNFMVQSIIGFGYPVSKLEGIPHSELDCQRIHESKF